MRTYNIPSWYRKSKRYPHYASCTGAILTLISSNYHCLEHLFMVPKVFEPFKFGCNINAPANNAYICQNDADGMKKV